MMIEDIKALLEFYNIEENIFIGATPASPDNLIAIFTSGGYTPTLKEIQEPTFQIKVRHTSYKEGYKLIKKIKDLLLNTINYSSESYNFAEFYQIGDIIELGRDENNRINFSLNIRTYVTKNTIGNPNLPEIGDCKELQETIRILQEDIVRLDEEIEELQEFIRTLQELNKNLEGNNEELQEGMEELEHLKNELLQEKNSLIEENNNLLNDLEKAQNLGALLTEENKGLKANILEKDITIEGLEGEIGELNEDKLLLEGEVTSLNEELGELQVEIGILELDKQALQQVIKDIEEENRGLDEDIESLELQISLLESQKLTLEEMIENLEGNIGFLEGEIEDLEGRIQGLELLVVELENEIDRLEAIIEEMGQNEDTMKIFIDLGSEDYQTEALNWNNLTDPIEGIIEDCIDENLNYTGISVSVFNGFTSTFVNNYSEDFGDYYYRNVILDGFIHSKRGNASLLIENLNPNKFYRVTFFSSVDSNVGALSNTCSITEALTPVSANNLLYAARNNQGATQSRTLKSPAGKIHLHFNNITNSYNSVVNAIEIEEMKPFIESL